MNKARIVLFLIDFCIVEVNLSKVYDFQLTRICHEMARLLRSQLFLVFSKERHAGGIAD